MESNYYISFAKIDFNCPYCNKSYKDNEGKYLDRCHKNKSGITYINCSCKNKFGMTYDITGSAVGFKII